MEKPVRSIKNQYRGINAHLQSRVQDSANLWSSFHLNYIADLQRSLNAILPPLGYIAEAEQGLQIQRFGAEWRRPRSDVTIYDTEPARPPKAASSPPLANTAELVVPSIEMFEEVEEAYFYKAILIYEFKEDLGEPVAWIELLSPSNKPRGRDYNDYRQKRQKLLDNGIVFVEIDYLHETPPTVLPVANYRPRNAPPEPGSHPYRISVTDPRPTFAQGQGRIREFDVDDPIPTMTIPLSGEDAIPFDFNRPYQKTFEEVGYGNRVDYRELPINFDRYSPADQTRILRRMLTVLEAAQRGEDLEHAPLPLREEVTLEDALALLAQMTNGSNDQ